MIHSTARWAKWVNEPRLAIVRTYQGGIGLSYLNHAAVESEDRIWTFLLIGMTPFCAVIEGGKPGLDRRRRESSMGVFSPLIHLVSSGKSAINAGREIPGLGYAYCPGLSG